MPEQNAPKAVVLVSGGLDSTTAMAVARQEGFRLYALSVDYGQRHRVELEAARRVAAAMDAAEHKIVTLDLRAIGGSALTSDAIDVPTDRSPDAIAHGIPQTYVPARNLVFLSVAVGWAEVVGARDIFVGVNALDYSGYPDCRPEFVEAFEEAANRGTKAGAEGDRIRIHAPLVRMTKAEIIRLGLSLGVDYSVTTSCYRPAEDGTACGRCDACQLRLKGFREAGARDPIAYQQRAQ